MLVGSIVFAVYNSLKELMTLFRTDAYLRQAEGRVVAHTAEGGVILDQSLFYPHGGGQPGDSGRIT